MGFDGDGAHAVRLGDRDFAPYLDALRSDVVARILHDDPPAGRDVSRRVRADSLDGVAADDENDASRALPITTRFYFHVTRASPKLNAAVEAAIRDAIASKSGSSGSLDDSLDPASPALVPHEAVDDVLAQDHRRSSSAYTVYLLNPNPPGDRPYAYSYRARSPAANGSEANPDARASCRSSERRVWFDLTAKPSSAGPRQA